MREGHWVASLWASDDRPPSLYWRQLDSGIAIASEPFGDPGDHWHPVAAGTHMIVDGGAARCEEFAVLETQPA